MDEDISQFLEENEYKNTEKSLKMSRCSRPFSGNEMMKITL